MLTLALLLALLVLVISLWRGRLRIAGVAFLVAGCAGLLLYCASVTQIYTNDSQVARMKAQMITNAPAGHPEMSIEVTLYSDGTATSDETYLVQGDVWELQANMVKVNGFLSSVGVRSGCKLTRLEGRYTNARLEANSTHSVVTLNGGDDGFFQATHFFEGILSPLIDSSYGNAVENGPGIYNVYVSQSGLWTKKA